MNEKKILFYTYLAINIIIFICLQLLDNQNWELNRVLKSLCAFKSFINIYRIKYERMKIDYKTLFKINIREIVMNNDIPEIRI